MPRRSALLIHAGAVTHDERAALVPDSLEAAGADETDERASALTWLFPWLLALTGIVITLALMQ